MKLSKYEYDVGVDSLVKEIKAAVADEIVGFAAALWAASRDPGTDASMGASLAEVLTEAGHAELATRVSAHLELMPEE